MVQLRLRRRLHIKEDEWNQNCNFLKFLIIIVEIIFGVKKIKIFILVDPSRGLVRVYCLYVCMFVFCFALLYNSPGAGAGAGAVLFFKGRSRSRSRRKTGGFETLPNWSKNVPKLIQKCSQFDQKMFPIFLLNVLNWILPNFRLLYRFYFGCRLAISTNHPPL